MAFSDAQSIVNSSAKDKQLIETDRTNQSSGSLTELTLKNQGLTREQIADRMKEQGDSISIDYGNGRDASRKTGLTEKDLVTVDELDKRPIRDYGWGFNSDIPPKIETGVEYQVGTQLEFQAQYNKPDITDQAVFERVAAMPIDKQAQILSAGIQAYQQEINHQQFRVAVGEITGVGESVVGMAQGVDSLGKSICDVAQFSRDLAENNPRAADTAEQASKSFGKLLVGGIRVVEVADGYLGSLGAASYEGDNTKAFRDVSGLGQRINQRWSEMSTEEKTSLTTRLTLDNLGPIAAAGAGAKLAKSIDVAGALQDLGASASVFGGRERDKYSRVIGEMVEKLTPQPMGVTPNGRLMPIPKDRLKTDGNMLMSKADDLGNSGRLVSNGVDTTGKALGFSKESGIELGVARPGQDGLWQEVPVVSGNEVHVGLGENLPSGTKTIDRVVIRDGVAESIKSIDPRLDSYRQPSDFRNKINDYLSKIEIYEGQPRRRQSFQMKKDQIEQKILHLGIPDGALTSQQVKVLEDLGRQVMKSNLSLPPDKAPLKIKVTVLK